MKNKPMIFERVGKTIYAREFGAPISSRKQIN